MSRGIIISAILAILFAGGFTLSIANDHALLANSFEVASIVTPAPIASATWTFESKFLEARRLLELIPLKVGATELTYTETVATTFPNLSVHSVTRKEREKEIALALLEKSTGRIIPVVITKRGSELIAPKKYPIGILERPNGIRWNKWNTQYLPPSEYIVIMNSYPDDTGTLEKKTVVNSKGKKVTVYEPKIEQFIYAPYSDDLHVPELVEAGRVHVKQTVARALELISARKVRSQAYPGSYISGVPALKAEFFELLPIIEQTDMTEFILDPRRTSERVLAIIGSNPVVAFAKTGSYAGALGWVQYTKKTYDAIRKLYPEAQLNADFKLGVADHLNSMIAAVLLYDYHLAQIKRSSSSSVATDPRLEEYLAAAYNGGPSRISNSLTASILRRAADWTGGLRDETKGYIVKLRALREMKLMD